MRTIISLFGLCVLLSCAVSAQVMYPEELDIGTPRILQQRYMPQLKSIATDLKEHQFPYPFYCSRALDIPEVQQQRADQRSLRFEKYNGQTMLMLTGNYYAAYSVELMDKNARLKKTFEDVVLPLLRIEAKYFRKDDDSVVGFAFEIGYHIRKKVAGVSSENSENAVYVFPRSAADVLAVAKDDDQIQAAILDSQVFLDAEPFNLWVTANKPSDDEIFRRKEERAQSLKQQASPASNNKNLMQAIPKPTRIITPTDLKNLKMVHEDDIAKILGSMREQAHFVSYASPEFIGFKEAIYLELPIETDLITVGDPSRYKLAALAFDEHVSHLVRPILAYFENVTDFDGIVFSSTIKEKGKDSSLAVEYFFNFIPMKCFAQYDCTGQQLLDSGYILINGERSNINLMQAESEDRKH